MKRPTLIEKTREVLRLLHYSYSTEQTYVYWIRQFLVFHNMRHPRDMREKEIRDFLSHLAVVKNVAAKTQDQAKHALLFLYKKVLEIELAYIDDIEKPKKQRRMPTVFTKAEAKAVLSHMSGRYWLIASLLYGSGLRLKECLRLRVKDIEFEQNQVIVMDGKGGKDRVTMLPEMLKEPLALHLNTVRELHSKFIKKGYGTVELPYALARKYPNAERELKWQYVFPADNVSTDPRSLFVAFSFF